MNRFLLNLFVTAFAAFLCAGFFCICVFAFVYFATDPPEITSLARTVTLVYYSLLTSAGILAAKDVALQVIHLWRGTVR